MIHPNTEIRFIRPEIGYGVVATSFIPKGTIVWAQDQIDRVFTPEQVLKMDNFHAGLIDKYAYRNQFGHFIVCWDSGKYVNHSFNSNCVSTAYDFELAVRDIEPGEELTDDYGYLNVTHPFDCLPEHGSQRTRVYPDDLLNYYYIWDAKLIDAFQAFLSVDQPLKVLINPQMLKKSEAICNGVIQMDSIRNIYFNDNKNAIESERILPDNA